jgi:hypothetical protein
MYPDLREIEFDWFATDLDGNVALFATAGEGFFPESVAEHHEDHSSLSESLPAPRSGTPEVWKDYAVLGLYVFDWALPGGPYEMRASLTSSAARELINKVMAVPELPRFNGSFSGLSLLESWQ